MEDIWYEYDDFKYYKKQYHEPQREYNDDSTYYCIGNHKGRKHLSPDPYNFYFFRDGLWTTYNKNGEYIAHMQFKKGMLDGQYDLYNSEIGFEANGFFKNGKMARAWEFVFEDNRYSYTIHDNNIIIYDVNYYNSANDFPTYW